MITTKYRDQYRDDIIRLGKEFEAEWAKEFGLGLNDGALEAAIEEQKDSSWLMVIDGRVQGFLSGMICELYAIPGLTWQECVWFVSKPYRKSRESAMLLSRALKDLKKRGVDTIIMAHMNNGPGIRLGMFFERMGFEPFETHYIKRL
jgi:hypothetical protein